MTILDRELRLGGGDHNRTFLFGKSPEAGYPPYNVELLDKDEDGANVLRITLAVAGFSLDDLSITVENGRLVVSGQQNEERGREFLYRGIASRRFKRSFELASGVEVASAELHNGLLAIELVRPRRDERVRTVPIKNGEHVSPSAGGLRAGARPSGNDAEENE